MTSATLRRYDYKEVPPVELSVDQGDGFLASCSNFLGLARSESMAVSNDPRFFAKNVMDKRMGAFAGLAFVSSLMLGISLKQCFSLKTNMDFSKWEPLVGCLAIWEMVAFCLGLSVVCLCLISLYVVAHQLFYTYRLITAGPTGFEQASLFYLSSIITMWRHLAIKALFNGLWMFVLMIGTQLFVKFIEDAKSVGNHPPEGVTVVNMAADGSLEKPVLNPDKHHKLDMNWHSSLAYVVFGLMTSFAILLFIIRRQHLVVFHQNYQMCKPRTRPIENMVQGVWMRSVGFVET